MRILIGILLYIVSFGSFGETIRVVIGLSPSSTFPVIVKSITDNVGDKDLNFVPEYRVGQGNLLAYQYASKAKPDGRTLVFTSTSVVINPLLNKDAGYSHKDFEPVIFIGKVPSSILVNKVVPVRGIKDLINYAKKKPDFITYGHQGFATQSFLAMELLANDTKTSFTNIPYRDNNVAVMDMMSGNIDIIMVIFGRTMGYLETNKVRLIATTGSQREKQTPDTPTVGETIKGFESYVHYAIQVPVGVSREFLDRLRKEFVIGIKNEKTQKLLGNLAIQYKDLSVEESSVIFDREYNKWSKVIKAKNIRIN